LVSDLSHGKSNYQFFLYDIGWCPTLAQPWVRSDTDGFYKKKMVFLMAKPMVWALLTDAP
jgi:hypothetical protein